MHVKYSIPKKKVCVFQEISWWDFSVNFLTTLQCSYAKAEANVTASRFIFWKRWRSSKHGPCSAYIQIEAVHESILQEGRLLEAISASLGNDPHFAYIWIKLIPRELFESKPLRTESTWASLLLSRDLPRFQDRNQMCGGCCIWS